jgi:hypothetical protein
MVHLKDGKLCRAMDFTVIDMGKYSYLLYYLKEIALLRIET